MMEEKDKDEGKGATAESTIQDLDFKTMSISQQAAVVRKLAKTDLYGCVLRKLDTKHISPRTYHIFLNEDQIDELQDIFVAIDTDGSNSIDFEELREGFREMELDVEDGYLSTIMTELNKGKEVSINFDEFAALFFRIKIALRKAEEERQNKNERELPFCSKMISRYISPVRKGIWDLFDDPGSSKLAQIIAAVIIGIIILSCILFMVETTAFFQMRPELLAALEEFEYISVLVFSVEFGCRLLSCPKLSSFVKSGLNWVDLMAILPFYIELYVASTNSTFIDASSLKVLRLVRIFRVLKIGRYFSWMGVFVDTLDQSLFPLGMVFFIIVIGLVVLSSIVYFVERGEWNYDANLFYRDEGLGNLPSEFRSIPATFWYIMSTLTSAGFGDMAPIYPFGKFIGVVSGVFGILVLAIPISVISSNFKFEYDRMKTKQEIEQERVFRTNNPKKHILDSEMSSQSGPSKHLKKLVKETRRFSAATEQEHHLFAHLLLKSCRANNKRIFKELKHRERNNRHHLIEYVTTIEEEYLNKREIDPAQV